MKKISKLTMTLSILLLMSFVASVPIASATPSNNSVSTRPSPEGVVAERSAEKQVAAENIEVLGAPGSGWKPDIQVAGTSNDEVNPSMASYIDPNTGAVTLYVAVQVYISTLGWNQIYIYRSDNRGLSWYHWRTNALAGRGANNPSIAVSPHNGTVFVAVDSYSPVTNFDIILFRNEPTWWTAYWIDGDADDDCSPQLVSEYSFGSGNWLYVSYEMYWNYDDRDLYFGYSTDWGKTWSKKVLRGGAGQPDVGDVFTQSDIAYVQRNVYIAYRHSTDYNTPGRIEVMYSTDYGGTFKGPIEASPTTKIDAWNPSITGSHAGPAQKPTTLWIAYENASVSPSYWDIFVSWSKDYGDTWSSPETIAGTSNDERRPRLSVDGMGTESLNAPGNFHLVYWSSESTPTRTNAIYYTQIRYYEPDWRPDPQVFGYTEGWSTPKGQIVDNNGKVTLYGRGPTITTFTRTVGGEKLWMPSVAWLDDRNYATAYGDIYFTTLDTMFSVTFYPSSQTAVAGRSLSYYVTVNLISGATATATLYLTGRLISWWPGYIWSYMYSPPTVTPTGASLLTFDTLNSMPAGSYAINASAVIGGYRRYATIPFTVTAPPTLTLSISPSTVARGSQVTISGKLTPGMTTTIYLFYRFPHATGSWALATTIPTTSTGTYSVTATVPMSLTPGIYDLIAVWFNPANGSYAASPIRVLTIT